MFRSLLILALPALLMGQGTPPSKAKPAPPSGAQKEELRLRLHRFRTERLQQSLGVSEEKARSIADRWGQFDQDSQGSRQRMRRLHRQVNDILLSPIPEEEKNAKIKPLVEQLATLRQQQEEQKRKFESDIRATLTPAQQGRFILAVEDIQRDMLQAIKQHKKGGSIETEP